MTIYTRRGDTGDTSLAGGTRVRKDSVRVEAYGALDEANSCVGLARSGVTDEVLGDLLRFVQNRLFNCSAQLASETRVEPDSPLLITHGDVAVLERAVDHFELRTGAPAGFVLEGGCETAARLHVARAVVRRAERRAISLASEAELDANLLAFLNRLSDTLFAAARYANALDATAEESWDQNALPPTPLGDYRPPIRCLQSRVCTANRAARHGSARRVWGSAILVSRSPDGSSLS